MIYEGYPKKEEEQQKFSKRTSLKDTFVLPPLKAHIFDPERTKMVHEAKLRNCVMLRIIELMSLTREDSKKRYVVAASPMPTLASTSWARLMRRCFHIVALLRRQISMK